MAAPYYIRAIIDAATLPRPEYNSEIEMELLHDGMIVKTQSGSITITAKGIAYLELLIAVPFPVQKWMDPREQSK